MSSIGKTMNRTKPLRELAARFNISTDDEQEPRYGLDYKRNKRQYFVCYGPLKPHRVAVPMVVHHVVKALVGR